MGLEIKNLDVELKDNGKSKKILHGISLEVKSGQVVALMGPNGSGKSTLAYALMGNPKYNISSGKIFLDEEEITETKPDERARKGLFLSFQNPLEISGVTISSFLRSAVNAKSNGKENGKVKVSVFEFKKLLQEKLEQFKFDKSFAYRYLNEGFSGGEKKKAEILQLAMLQPKYAILDETDSGLDIDALKIVADGVNKIKEENKTGILLITHYHRILNYIKPDKVYIVVNGRIIAGGGEELAREIEETGYESFD